MKTNRPTIALLMNDFQPTEIPIWNGVSQTAKLLNVNLITLAGGHYTSWNRNKAYNLIDKEHINGIICITGCIGNFTTEENMIDFLRFFDPLPIINIGPPIPGYLNMVLDNKAGMRQLVEHFINIHHYRQIAFISGPADNFEAQLRLKSYQEVLAENDLDYNPDLVYYGDFWASGSTAVQHFMDDKKIDFDAIIAANDFMALGAMKELQNRGLRIPDDIGIGGFDDISKAKNTDPSLTTVVQPFYEMGVESLKNILTLIRGEAIENLTIPTHIVVRNSCGCNTNNYVKAHHFIDDNSCLEITTKNLQEILEKVSSVLSAQFPEISSKMKESTWATNLIHHLLVEITELNKVFLNFLCQLVKKGVENGIEVSEWYPVIKYSVVLLKPFLDNEQKEHLSELRADSNEVLGNIIIDNKSNTDNLHDDQINIINTLILELNQSWVMGAEQLNNYRNALNSLNIQNFYLCQYENEERTQAKITFQFNKKPLSEPPSETNIFPTKLLIPGWFENSNSNLGIIIPIFNIGYIYFETNVFDFHVDASLFPQLTLSIRQLSLISEVIKYATELEKKVAARTKQLMDIQQQMIETAHRAGMTEISISIIHNIGNLLTSASIATETIENIIEQSKISGLLKANKLLTSHRADINSLNSNKDFHKLVDYYEIIGTELKKEQDKIISENKLLVEKISLIHASIHSLQDLTMTVTPSTEEIDIIVLIEDSLRLQEDLITSNFIKLIKDYPQVQLIIASKTKLYYILVNLIKNAIEALYNTPVEERLISIRVFSDQENNVVIEIRDNGEGIPSENLTRIFNYGFTTKPGGHGFALHTCANYMKEMGGQINVASNSLNNGTTFTLTFLLNK